jgi:hypothetical protein
MGWDSARPDIPSGTGNSSRKPGQRSIGTTDVLQINAL